MNAHSGSTRLSRAAYVLAKAGVALMAVLLAYALFHSPKSRPSTDPNVHGLEWVAGPLDTPLTLAMIGALALGVLAGAAHAITASGLPGRFRPLGVTLAISVACLVGGALAYTFIQLLTLGM